jgi:Fanconi anemia group M protein
VALPAQLPAARAVVGDVHEPAEVLEGVRQRGVPVEVRRLQPADYVIGPLAVERKTIGDFASSLFNKRLFDQVGRIKESYPQALLVLEGDLAALEDFENPQAFYGALCAISLDRGMSVIPTADKDHTAMLLATLFKRMEKDPSPYGLRYKPPYLGPDQEMLFVLQGLPHVGSVLSERLLDSFGTVRRVMRASERELRRVALMGPEKARRVTEVLDRPWKGRQLRLEDEEDGA